MTDFFQFEADFVASLRCIPMQVRYRLDTCGIKLKLHQWQKFDLADRQQLVENTTDSPAEIGKYRQLLIDLIQKRTGEVATELAIDPQPPWLDPTVIPAAVHRRMVAAQLAVTGPQWSQLSPVQRFALIKLSGSSHEQNNFMPALREFGLLPQ